MAPVTYRELSSKQELPRLYALVVTGAFIGFLCASVDLAITKTRMGLTLHELFLLTKGTFGISISSYDLLLFPLIGGAVGIVSHALLRCRPPATVERARRAHLLLSLALLGSFLYLTRTYLSYNSDGEAVTTYRQLGASAAALVLAILVTYLFLRTSGVSRALYDDVVIVCIAVWLAVSVGLSLAWPRMYPPLLRLMKAPERGEISRPNVLLLVLDTVRADYLSAYGNAGRTTPHIDAVVREGALFLEAVSAAPWTLPSHASLFTGLYPSQHGAGWEYQHLDAEFTTLAEYLHEEGYRTVGLSENPFVSEGFGLTQGFESFHAMYGWNDKKPVGLAVAEKMRRLLSSAADTKEYSRDTVARIKSWILTRHRSDRPFFMFANFMAAHLPSYPRPDIAKRTYDDDTLARIKPIGEVPERYYLDEYRLTDEDLEVMKELYADDLRYLDSEIGRLVEFLRRMDLLDRTVLVITSDHGENFGEHGLIEHQFCLYNSLLHVPLILRYPPTIEAGLVVKERVSTAFLFETILDLVEVRAEPRLPGIESRSLLDGPYGTIWSEYDNAVEMLRKVIGDEAPDFDFEPFDRRLQCAFDGGHKFIRSSNGKNELYRVSDDWTERENLIASEVKKGSELAEKLTRWQEALYRPPHRGEGPMIDAETKERLEALGYLK